MNEQHNALLATHYSGIAPTKQPEANNVLAHSRLAAPFAGAFALIRIATPFAGAFALIRVAAPLAGALMRT